MLSFDVGKWDVNLNPIKDLNAFDFLLLRNILVEVLIDFAVV